MSLGKVDLKTDKYWIRKGDQVSVECIWSVFLQKSIDLRIGVNAL